METKIDGGYGWTICAIACWMSASFGMADDGFSLIVGLLTKELNDSLALVSLGGALIATIQCILAPIYSLVGNLLGHREALTISLILAPISLGLSGFVTNTSLFIASYCIVPGLCYGQISLSALSIMISYFDKKLTIANGLFKGALTLGIVVHSMPVNYLALNYNPVKYNSMYMMSLFLTCLLLMPFFYPQTKSVHHAQGTSDDSQNKTFHPVPAFLFYISVLFYWIGFYMTYTLIVEMVEFQAIRKITSFERSVIVLGHAMANGSSRMVGPIISQYWNIPSQLMCACFLIVNICVTMGFIIVTDFYVLLTLVILFGICTGPSAAFDTGIALELLGPNRDELAISILYVCMGIGHMPGAPLAGYLYEISESYFWSLTGCALCHLISACCNILSDLYRQRIGYEKL